MEYLVGITLALLFCGAAARLGMDRERVFYPAVLIAVASYYLAFAVVDGRGEVMLHNTGVPQVWPGFCMTFDVTAAAFVAWVMLARARGEREQQSLSLG